MRSAAFDGIVIGQGHRHQPKLGAAPGQFLRGEGAVGKKGVQVKIGKSFAADAGRVAP